jgi:hypothetical protein
MRPSDRVGNAAATALREVLQQQAVEATSRLKETSAFRE